MPSSDDSSPGGSRSHDPDEEHVPGNDAIGASTEEVLDSATSPAEQPAGSAGWFFAGLALTPVLLVGASLLAPRLVLGRGMQDLSTFVAAVSTLVGSALLLAHGRAPGRTRLTLALIAGGAIGILAYTGVQSTFAVVVVGSSLVILGHGVGHAVGSRIEHPGHLLPASVVAGCADLVSVIHPQGPTHAVVASRHALDLLTLSFPVLGTRAFAPTIGAGDMVFLSLVFGASLRHRLSLLRAALLIWIALLLAGVASALLARAVPALPIMGLLVVLGMGEARRLRSRDRKVAVAFMAASVVVAMGVVLSRFFA